MIFAAPKFLTFGAGPFENQLVVSLRSDRILSIDEAVHADGLPVTAIEYEGRAAPVIVNHDVHDVVAVVNQALSGGLSPPPERKDPPAIGKRQPRGVV